MKIEKGFDFSRWLLSELIERNISENDLAKKSGISANGIRNLIYNYRQPRFDTFTRIMDALGKEIIVKDKSAE